MSEQIIEILANPVCFCGGEMTGVTSHPDYQLCRSCRSGILRQELKALDLSTVADEANHLYGKSYWDKHQAELGLPPIEARSRLDLPERCQYWLGYLLQHYLPPARVLELGCAHGGFVKLLRLAGYDAIGLEMSPEVAADSRTRFGINIFLGPLEVAGSEIGKYDVIALFDVLEHVPNPSATIQAIAEHLTDDGVVVIQTPRHDNITDQKWPMYVVPEHTFLYSSIGLTKLLASAGLTHVQFEKPIFGYDQFVFASRRPIPMNSPAVISEHLLTTPNGRMVLAMQDLYEQVRSLLKCDPSRYGSRVLAKELLKSIPRAVARRLKG